MVSNETLRFGAGPDPWSLPDREQFRQAIAPLRGYVYQLHNSLAAWIALPPGAELYLEVAEDYATVAHDPTTLDEVLTATQVKDTRQSGAVTLNSADVLDAIGRLFALQQANPNRPVRLTFLTTSPIGVERKLPLPSGVAGLTAWQTSAGGGDVAEVRAALQARFQSGPIFAFLQTSSDEELRNRLLKNLTFVCGASDGPDIEVQNRRALVSIRSEVQAAQDLAERAADVLLAHVWRTVVSSSPRVLNHEDFLLRFRQATSIAMPSQTVVDLAIKGATPHAITARDVSIDESELRKIANTLLIAGSPPSLLVLFPDATPQIRQALGHLSSLRRTVAKPDDQRRATITIEKLAAAEKLHNLFVGPPGSGKTHALWHAARDMLEHDCIIPLFVPLNGSMTWNDVLQVIADVAGGREITAILRDPRVCICLDDWSEFGTAHHANERMRAMRVLNETRVIANARRGADTDSWFDVWTLDPVPVSAVRQTLRTAFPSALLPTAVLIELLRLPLALSLFVLLGGAATSRGELLDHLHRHLSRTVPERLRELLAGAVAAMNLTNSRSFSRLLSEIRARKDPSIQEPIQLLERLGTIEDRAGIALPIHDLYWSWLSGLGLFAENRILDALPHLSTRESYQLALESGARPSEAMVEIATGRDIVLAAKLDASLDPRATQSASLIRRLDEMLVDDRLPIRCRAAAAAIHSRKAQYILPALRVLTQATEASLYVPQLVEALTADNLFDNRGVIFEWLGSAGTELLLDAISDNGGPEWGPWFEQLANSGRVAPELALAAALACEANIPKWGEPYLGSLVKDQPWKLGAATKRGVNVDLARWVAAHYDDQAGHSSGKWFHKNKLLVSCGDQTVFQMLLDRFQSMSSSAQETLGFAIVELDDHWIAQFQRKVFSSVGGRHHHQLLERVSLEIADVTAREWIARGYSELGWRILIARHGNAIIPELVAKMPASFDGLHDIPTMQAMRYLDAAPISLIREIWRRVGGIMQPKAMQDVLNALASIRPEGVASIVNYIIAQPMALPTYHLNQALTLFDLWQKDTHLAIMLETPAGKIPFREWILVTRLLSDRNDPMFQRALASAPDLAIRTILTAFSNDDVAAKSVLENIGTVASYHPELFAHMIARPALCALVPTLFAPCFDTFPEIALRQAVESPDVDFKVLLMRLANSSTAMHRSLHGEIVVKVLREKFDLFSYRYVGNILRVHQRGDLLELLRAVVVCDSADAMWLVREIETARQELLIDEGGQWLS